MNEARVRKDDLGLTQASLRRRSFVYIPITITKKFHLFFCFCWDYENMIIHHSTTGGRKLPSPGVCAYIQIDGDHISRFR